MRITICGSMKFHRDMRETKKMLEDMGHEAILPMGTDEEVPIEAREDVTKDEIVVAKIEFDFIRRHFRNIEGSDAILVLNYEKNGIPNYIGGNTFLEMGIAFWLGKTIYLLHPVPEMDYYTEMHAMSPVVLHGSLEGIASR